ncbi:response regulator transcription factor [Aquincola sp. S2]|uniref:Response regulator transcription factor n=1 Tax=Pseudaquabacterium terrae TaxID=2732868 RepID=A0ABX2EMD5_9BURK|nr:response regulator transcription factor [Aquabacterium terrae]NRF69822.1 response regulator transcription factor [Aquabacterium terrae]
MTPPAITVALVEDDATVRERFARVIAANPELQLLHAAATAQQMLDWLADNAADVLLVDLGLPDRPGLDVIRHCRQVQPACQVMVISIFGDEANMLRAFECGARGYLLKDGNEQDLAAHVLNLHGGGSPMSPIIARQLLVRWQAGGQTPTPTPAAAPARPAPMSAPLSGKESQVLDLVARGFTYQEVAQHLGVAVTTVQTHVRNIYGKLDVHNKAEALFEARQLGLLRH